MRLTYFILIMFQVHYLFENTAISMKFFDMCQNIAASCSSRRPKPSLAGTSWSASPARRAQLTAKSGSGSSDVMVVGTARARVRYSAENTKYK